MKLGIIVFANNSGLGNQTKRLCQMLKPDKILAIDSTSFSKNKKQNWDWYNGFSGYKVSGFPKDHEVRVFLKGLSHVILCENPLNFSLLSIAKKLGIKVYIQSNYEFCDHLNKNIVLPTKFIMPSYWKIEEMKEKFGNDLVEYLPPPLDPNEFKRAREINFKRNGSKKFLHIVGTLAAHDRNGTLDLIRAVEQCKNDFDLIIRSQRELPKEYISNNRHIKYIFEDSKSVQEMYNDYDAYILPRKYGGLSLTTNEALMSGLPVIMTDISPNNKLLPNNWLIKANKYDSFLTRTTIDLYRVDTQKLSRKIDEWAEKDLNKDKLDAFEIGYNSFAPSNLYKRYEDLLR